MKVKMILPALTEAVSPFWRPIKYSLFPPLGLATLAGYLDINDEIDLQDEHVEKLNLNDNPDLVVIQIYITNAYKAYKIADHYRKNGTYVILGGLHATSLPNEAKMHADSVFIGPGEDTFPLFLKDFKNGYPKPFYHSKKRTLKDAPLPRRDLIKYQLYLVPNSIVVSRGCPHICDFCYKESFFKGGRSFYTQEVSYALKEIDSLPGRHLFFLDDHLFGNIKFASDLFDGMAGMGRIWQAAGTVKSVLNKSLLKKAVDCGLKSLFIGFESLNINNLWGHSKYQNIRHNYEEAIKQLHDNGVMINGSFVFGMDNDDVNVFEKTVEWAVNNGIETATFHILTPYPGTRLFNRLSMQDRILIYSWDKYDTRHTVFKPAKMTEKELEEGYLKAYNYFYKWKSIIKSVMVKESISEMLKHLIYTGGWKKFEFLWGSIIKLKMVNKMLPLLELLLSNKKSKRYKHKIINKNGKEQRLIFAKNIVKH